MVPLSPFTICDGCLIVAVHMTTHHQVNEISNGAILPSRHAAEVDKRAVAETDLHAVGALDVVGHGQEEESPVAGANARANIGVAPINTPREEGDLSASKDATPDARDKGCQPIGFWLRLALAGDNMQTPLSNTLFADAGFSGHSPPGAGMGLHPNRTESDSEIDGEG